ncbi:restriction endonuclease subunit S [Thauera aromatica]|nr:restriction endonuclease subunit S [Thauera aromatica]
MSLPRHAEYKDSGIAWLGQVPSHWAIKRLRFVAELNPSKSELAGIDRATVVSFLPMEAIGDDGSINLERTRPISEVETGYTYFRDGDVTLAKITPCFENGKGALMQGLEAGIGFGTTELIVARPNPSEVLGPLLNWIFRSPNFRAQGEASMYGAGGQKRVPDDFVRDFAWSFPPLREQSAIAAFLDRETAKIDALIAEQEKLIALLAEKRQATISHAVTKGLNPNAPMKDSGVAWLGAVPAHWDVVRVKALSQFSTSGPRGWSERITEEGSLFIQSGDLNDSMGLDYETAKRVNVGDDAEASRTRLVEGDVVVCITGAKTGNVALCASLREPAYVNQHLCLIRPNVEVHGRFLALSLKSTVGQTQFEVSQYGLKQGLSLENVRDLFVALPPRGEQDVIVNCLDAETTQLDALRAEAERAIALLKERRSALIAAAVTGQIDVRDIRPM